jgi:hypothetical protein
MSEQGLLTSTSFRIHHSSIILLFVATQSWVTEKTLLSNLQKKKKKNTKLPKCSEPFTPIRMNEWNINILVFETIIIVIIKHIVSVNGFFRLWYFTAQSSF